VTALHTFLPPSGQKLSSGCLELTGLFQLLFDLGHVQTLVDIVVFDAAHFQQTLFPAASTGQHSTTAFGALSLRSRIVSDPQTIIIPSSSGQRTSHRS
jgi:hypothetical protein